ncbi:MAG: hypothetical protein ABSH32_27505 [Bryobacteraceae bacterium]|jgi:hypothetical protein
MVAHHVADADRNLTLKLRGVGILTGFWKSPIHFESDSPMHFFICFIARLAQINPIAGSDADRND